MKKQTNLTLVDPELADLHRQFDELLAKTNKNNPNDADVRALSKLLEDNSTAKLWNRVAGVMAHAEGFMLNVASPLFPGLNEVFRHKQGDIREKLGYEGASEMEQLLISHASLCWLRLGLAEFYYSKALGSNTTFRALEHYEKALSGAQRRFTRACETLARVRRLQVMTSRQDQPARSALTA
jgi:hypothetical protein